MLSFTIAIENMNKKKQFSHVSSMKGWTWIEIVEMILRILLKHFESPVSTLFRGSLLEVFYKTGAFKNFEKLTVKHLCWSLFFNKVAGFQAFTLSQLHRNSHKYFLEPI